MEITAVAVLLAGLAVGAGAARLVFGSRQAALRAEVGRLEQAVAHERERADDRERYAAQVEARLSETIEAAASRAVKGNNEEFLALAGQRLAPIDRKFEALESMIRDLERARESAYGSITEQVRGLLTAQETLRGETGKLVSALHKPGVRGRWGELTLRRMVEMAGMVAHCDFVEQGTVDGEGGRFRPDLVVNLPGGGAVVVDSKAPLDSFLAAQEATDDADRERRLDEHVQALRDHVTALGRKAYWEQFERSPDFVVMFVPVEASVAVAAQRRTDLFDEGFSKNVVLATPSTLFALLRVVAFGWRQERMAESAEEVSALARDLHKRMAVLSGHWSTLGKRLDATVDAYNKTVGSLERNVLPQARRFEALGAGSKDEVVELTGLEARSRSLTAPEMTGDEHRVVEIGDRTAILDDPDYGTLGSAKGRTAEGR